MHAGVRAQVIEAHLAGCPRCRSEVEGHRETAALLASSFTCGLSFVFTHAKNQLWTQIWLLVTGRVLQRQEGS